MSDVDIIRFYPEARTAHLERATDMAESTTLYLHRRGDFDEALAAQRADFKQLSFWAVVLRVLRSPPRVLEVPEPMWFRYAPLVIILLWALRVFRPVTSRRTAIVTYVIENSPIERRPRPLKRLPQKLWLLSARILVAVQVNHLKRVAFGTNGARAALMGAVSERQRHRLATVSKVIEAIPAACECQSLTKRDRHHVLFLGALEHRKGVDVLLKAWPAVRKQVPAAHLTIAGSGALEGLVAEAVEHDSSITHVLGAARTRIHELLRSAQVVVLLSQPAGRWREQVGLPLVEGVAHGCRIVTTEETGLAEWLRSQGQTVITAPTDDSSAASSIIENLCSPEEGATYDVSRLDGRLQADAWLLASAGLV